MFKEYLRAKLQAPVVTRLFLLKCRINVPLNVIHYRHDIGEIMNALIKRFETYKGKINTFHVRVTDEA